MVQALSNLLMVSKLEDLLWSLYAYFLNFFNHHLEFINLAKIMEIKGFKIFLSVKIQWISMLEPLECVLP